MLGLQMIDLAAWGRNFMVIFMLFAFAHSPSLYLLLLSSLGGSLVHSFFMRISSYAFSFNFSLFMPSFESLLDMMFSLSLMIDVFSDTLDPKNWVTFSLPSWLGKAWKVLDVAWLDLKFCLRISHWLFNDGTADAHLNLYPYPLSFLLRPDMFTLETGRILQDSSLCSSANLYSLFCSWILTNNFKFSEVMVLRLLARFVCLFLRILSLMISDGVFFLRDRLKLFDLGLNYIDGWPCSLLCNTKRFWSSRGRFNSTGAVERGCS